MNTKHIYHLYSRAGFGISIADAKKLQDKTPVEIVDLFLNTADKKIDLALIQLSEIPTREKTSGMTIAAKKQMRKEVRDRTKDLNTAWMKQLITTQTPLLEKTTLFWHGHFACREEGNPYITQQLNNIQRQFAFAPFKDLLLAVSKSAAMLQFLNNKQNHKQHPNENFARELMELFTIGRGNYTEKDIQESARAFTGWTCSNDTFEFISKPKDHDTDSKTFMNQSGNFAGEDIINIILQQKQTAVFLCTKMYRFFVNEKENQKHINELADFYFTNNYDTGKLLKKLFTTDWFYDDINIGANIKSPVEFIVGLSKSFSIIPPNNVLLKLQRALGQTLFYPPNVAGWAGGKNWIDSSTLMLRLKIPSTILNGGKIDIIEKDDMPEDFKLPETLKINPDEKPFFANTTPEELIDNLLLPNLNDKKKKILLGDDSTNKQLVLKIVSMPEYQLC
ncbi:MAG: DUF1800 domain-containing protein [Bacteroidia bacterium]